MKLKPRTTYRNNGGKQVMIAGLTGEKHNGQPLFWSIQGDHYSEDGRFVSWTRDGKSLYPLGDSSLRRKLLPAGALSSLASEDASESAKSWWNGVVTERSAR